MDSLGISLERRHIVNPEDKYKCVKCDMTIIQPMQLECGHRICKTCCDILKESGSILKCPTNEEDCEDTIDLNQIFLDKSFLKEMMKLKVFCTYKIFGCEHTTAWSKIQEHESDCKHKDRECKFCHQIIPIFELENHIENACLKVQLTCPFKCSTTLFNRNELENHKDTCLKKPSSCKYMIIGCPYKGSADDVAKHEVDKLKHFDFLYDSYLINNGISKELTRSFQKLDTTVKELISQAERQGDSKTIEDTLSIIMNDFSQLSSKLTNDMNNLSTQVIPSTIAMAVSNIKPSGSIPDDMRQRFFKHEESIADHDKLLTSQDLRIQCLETANYCGELVWKISDYRRRKQQAVNGHILSLYSQPFYTDNYGYKMCARVYLNGDGIGKGTHLSLFFVIMQGDFDDILPWPFCRKVTFMLMDQKTQKRHLVDSFKPDKSSSSFQKPVTSMNIASGCPLFVAHATLENAEEVYLRNNILFLRVIVDKEDL